MPDTHYEHPRLAAIYDLSSGWSEDRDFYLELAGDTPSWILDLGCGTGLICRAYAKRPLCSKSREMLNLVIASPG